MSFVTAGSRSNGRPRGVRHLKKTWAAAWWRWVSAQSRHRNYTMKGVQPGWDGPR